MRIHTFIKRCERQQIVAYGVFNAAEIRDLERQGYRLQKYEDMKLPSKQTPENKNGIPVQGQRSSNHDKKSNTFRSRERARRAR